jgi:hypothetical protein
MTEKKNPRCTLVRSTTVSSRRPAHATTASQSRPPAVPDSPIKIFDLARKYVVHPEDDAKLTEQCPQVIIDAIRRRMEGVRSSVSAPGEGNEEINEEQHESPERAVNRGERDEPPTVTDVAAASEKTQLRLQTLEDENKMLRDCLIDCISQNIQASSPEGDSRTSAVKALTDELVNSQRQKSVLEHRVQELERNIRQDGDIFQMLLGAEPVSDGKLDCRRIIRHIRLDLEEHRALSEVLGPALTIRGVLALKMLQHQQAHLSDPSRGRGAASELDTVLLADEAIDLARQLDNSSHLLTLRSTSCIRDCSMCQKAKLLRMPPISTSSGQLKPLVLRTPFSSSTPMSEFNCSPSGRTPCCHQLICDECYYPSIVSSISTDWWRNLGSDRWLTCPFPTCSSLPPISHDTELSTILRACRDRSVLSHICRFERASRLRTAVAALHPTPQALSLAADLHAHLQKHNRILDPVDYHEDDNTIPSNTTHPLVELLPVSITTVTTTSTGTALATFSRPIKLHTQLQVPIFTGLLLRPGDPPASVPPSCKAGRKCDTCHLVIADLTTGTPESEARWAEAVKEFPGDWTWMVRAFPPRDVLRACSEAHELETCRWCLGVYIVREMMEKGRGVGCRTCGHVYGREEVRVLVSGEVFAEWKSLEEGGVNGEE